MTTANNDAASAAELFLLTHDSNLPDNHAFDYGAEEEELLPSDEDVVMPSYSRSGKENLDSGCGNESPTTSAAAKMKFTIPFPNDNNATKGTYFS